MLKPARVLETGCGAKVEEVLAEDTVLISLCSMALS